MKSMIGAVEQLVSRFFLVIGLSLATAAIAENAAAESPEAVIGEHFSVSYKSKVEPLPLNSIHTWMLHVDTLDGSPVENATITVSGGMPAHRHGLPTQPMVTEIGQGDYLVEGMKFSMTGLWEMWFDIRAGDLNDKVKFEISF